MYIICVRCICTLYVYVVCVRCICTFMYVCVYVFYVYDDVGFAFTFLRFVFYVLCIGGTRNHGGIYFILLKNAEISTSSKSTWSECLGIAVITSEYAVVRIRLDVPKKHDSIHWQIQPFGKTPTSAQCRACWWSATYTSGTT